MKTYTIEITTVNGVTAPAIFERSDLKTALSAHYSTMASALANPNCEEVLSMVINSVGGIHKSEHWKAPTSEPEPSPIQE